jgi:prevent-host-death family protein
VEEIAVSKFKATCLAVIERVRKTGEPVVLTRFGRPVAQLVAPPPVRRAGDWLGALAGTIEIRGDIVGPVVDPEEWEVLRD